MEAGASMRMFSGDDCDYREYRRWKQWALNKMRTMDKLGEEARGSFIWTLLSGRALEVVEHLKEEDYQKKGGEQAIFDLLDRRWPELDRTDEIGENIADVFALKAKEGETVRQWCARSREVFDKCARKTGVKFPEEARGWILLNCSGMSEADRAICLARAQGDLKFDQLSQAMRSCFPDYVMARKRTTAAHLVDDVESAPPAADMAGDGFQDVELFLAEHGYERDADGDLPDEEGLEEEDAAEILAATWRERRAELNQVQKGRRFTPTDRRNPPGQSKEFRRSFRVQVEELKQRTRRRRCGKIGHWQRECKAPAASSSTTTTSHAAGSVQCLDVDAPEHFVCSATVEQEVLLVSSPGFAILDSGCGKTIIGEDTLAAFRQIWLKHNIPAPREHAEVNRFRFGNGEQEVSQKVVEMPVFVANRPGLVRAAVVKGKAPLLLSRPALKTLQAQMSFADDRLTLFSDHVEVPLEVNAAGQYAVNVSQFPSDARSRFPAVSDEPVPEADPPSVECHSVAFNKPIGKKRDYWEFRPSDRLVIRHHVKPRTAMFTPANTRCPVPITSLHADRVTKVDHLTPQARDCSDSWTEPDLAHRQLGSRPWTGQTIFRLRLDADMPSVPSVDQEQILLAEWTAKQHRCLMAQVRSNPQVSNRPYDVIEVFSPPRFALEGTTRGLHVLSADLCTGWDFRRKADRERLKSIVRDTPPELLVVCPPCTWAGGWWHLNRLRMDSAAVTTREAWTTLFIRFCCELTQIQQLHGKRFLFEHPRDSVAWSMKPMMELTKQAFKVHVDMCCYGLRVPGGSLIRKATGLLVSHQDMLSLGRKCPGPSREGHRTHQCIAGQWPKIGSISRHAAKYTPAFVKAVLRLVKGLPTGECLCVGDSSWSECLVAQALEDLSDDNEHKMQLSLRKLHNNLGHPTNQQLLRILKHGGASAAALEAARRFTCDHCVAQQAPKAALPAQSQRVVEFNAVVGVDIKYLQGWVGNQRIPSLNIIDFANSLQIVVPLFKKETAETIKQAFLERWVSWAGMPSEIVCDPARANIADAFSSVMEQGGATFKLTAADAHWQLGKVEVHGGWFGKILSKLLAEHVPSNQAEWTECVNACHCKNQLIQVYGMTPSQFVFGKNPRVPENLLDEPLDVVPATASLYEEAVARQVAIRQTARKAVLELQDSKALRLALAARPRVTKTFPPGSYVACWRSQKWVHGSLEKTGRWCGPAVVLGYVGRNVVVIHKRQIFRCAPEQVRQSTQDELKLVDTPNMELLGIKRLIESKQLESRQYVDLVPESYPSEPNEPPAVLPDPGSSGPASVLDQVRADESQPMPGVEESPTEPQTPQTKANIWEPTHDVSSGPSSSSKGSTYGPVRPPRRQIHQKDGPTALYRPGPMAQEDFQELMQEIVPDLIQQVLQEQPKSLEQSSLDRPSESDSARGVKRSLEESVDPADLEPADKRATPPEGFDELLVQEIGHTFVRDEVAVLSVEVQSQVDPDRQSDRLEPQDRTALIQMYNNGASFEALVTAYMKKKTSKEVPASGNPPEVQLKIDEAKLFEWNTVSGKHAARLVLGPEAAEVRAHFGHRIMGSRFVVTVKTEDMLHPA